jgi:glutamate racemase
MTEPPQNDDRREVGVFDSGVGGLSILSEIQRQLPAESMVYLADQAWAPYGERTLEVLRDRTYMIVEHLMDRGVKAVVVACNTASAAALHELRRTFPTMPFVGMEPAVKPAAEQSNGRIVGVLATTATFQGELYASVVDRHAKGVGIVERAGTGLVELIEDGVLDGPVLDAALHSHLAPMLEANIDTLVLGCTHYPFVANHIRTILGDGVRLIDPAPAVARQLGRVLTQTGRAAGGGRGSTTFLTTGAPDVFAHQVGRLIDPLGVTVAQVTV